MFLNWSLEIDFAPATYALFKVSNNIITSAGNFCVYVGIITSHAYLGIATTSRSTSSMLLAYGRISEGERRKMLTPHYMYIFVMYMTNYLPVY